MNDAQQRAARELYAFGKWYLTPHHILEDDHFIEMGQRLRKALKLWESADKPDRFARDVAKRMRKRR